MRFVPSIRYGTEGYPEKTARRLRALNIATWSGTVLAASFAVAQFLDPSPAVKPVAVANAVTAALLASVPLFHRFGPLAAPLAFAVIAYVAILVITGMLGTATGMQIQFYGVMAIIVLALGPDRFWLCVVFAALAWALVVVLELFVPRNTGVQPELIMIGNFLAGTAATNAILLGVIYYALREAARAEAAAEREHARSESLLANILPGAVAARLKSRPGEVIADRHDDVSVLFADMEGYTARAGELPPEELVRFLDRVFTEFDRLVERHGLEKIKTTGDAYMVVSGVPTPRADHAQAMAALALDLRAAAAQMLDPLGRSVPIRIGLSSGPVVAGVVGTRRFFFDVWGDAVNVASRMESTGTAGRIQVSESTRRHLGNEFVLEPCGEIAVKGKGRMPTWFLIARRGGESEPVAVTASEAPEVTGRYEAVVATLTSARPQD